MRKAAQKVCRTVRAPGERAWRSLQNISWIIAVMGNTWITEQSRKEAIIKYSQGQPPNYSGLRSKQMAPRKRAADSELIIIM